LIRINLRDSDFEKEFKFNQISLPLKAKYALEEIKKYINKE
jgi:hypothetical protein